MIFDLSGFSAGGPKLGMAWQALPQQLAQLPSRLQHRNGQPCRQRHRRHRTRAAVLSTPVEEQAQRKSTLEALQSALTITAAKTPYLENGKIDLRQYDKLLERQIEGGVEGVIVGGTTGEGQVSVFFQPVGFHGLDGHDILLLQLFVPEHCNLPAHTADRAEEFP